MKAAGTVGLRALGEVVVHDGEDAVAHVAEHELEDVAEHGAEQEAEHAAESCALSFASSTLVTTPTGQRSISSLEVGDTVTAYDPATGKGSIQTVQHTYINHDSNLLAVTLRTVASTSASQATAVNATKQRDAAVAAHGAQAPPTSAATTAPTSHDETIQTTTNHPWLTADHGWILASFLRVGEPVRRVDGSVALVVGVAGYRGVKVEGTVVAEQSVRHRLLCWLPTAGTLLFVEGALFDPNTNKWLQTALRKERVDGGGISRVRCHRRWFPHWPRTYLQHLASSPSGMGVVSQREAMWFA